MLPHTYVILVYSCVVYVTSRLNLEKIRTMNRSKNMSPLPVSGFIRCIYPQIIEACLKLKLRFNSSMFQLVIGQPLLWIIIDIKKIPNCRKFNGFNITVWIILYINKQKTTIFQ